MERETIQKDQITLRAIHSFEGGADDFHGNGLDRWRTVAEGGGLSRHVAEQQRVVVAGGVAEGGGLLRHVAEQQRVVVVGGGDEHRHAFDDDVSHDATDHHGRALVPAMHVLLLVQVTHWPNGNKDFFTGET
uniref:Uncharacterized protein n=1 Tax=Oryza meridionalis TaxID=40149 RepID=A0A0E0CJL3_9ORYZ